MTVKGGEHARRWGRERKREKKRGVGASVEYEGKELRSCSKERGGVRGVEYARRGRS